MSIKVKKIKSEAKEWRATTLTEALVEINVTLKMLVEKTAEIGSAIDGVGQAIDNVTRRME